MNYLVFGKLIDSLNLNPLPQVKGSFVHSLISILISITAAIALLIIVIAGFRYIVSQGDPKAVAKAKGAIIYALVGLLVAILAQAIVVFVFKGIQ